MSLPPDQQKQITLVLSERCDLACRYCFLVARQPGRRMSDDVLEQTLSYLLENRDLFPEPSCAWTIGSCEPLLDVPHMERVVERVLQRARELQHPWADQSEIHLITNGLHYLEDDVQRFVTRHRERLTIRLSIDGAAAAHDRCRVDGRGRGTHAAVMRAIPRWLEQFPEGSAKVTLVPETCHLLAGSVEFLFGQGIRTVHVEPIMGARWTAEHAQEYESQLDRLGERVAPGGRYEGFHCSLLNPHLEGGGASDDRNCCNPGQQLTIDTDGGIYGCPRFLPMATADRHTRSLGDVWQGLEANRLRAFRALTRTSLSPRDCMSCDVSQGCRWCPGETYFQTSPRTIYGRETSRCRLHQARVRANRRLRERRSEAETREPR